MDTHSITLSSGGDAIDIKQADYDKILQIHREKKGNLFFQLSGVNTWVNALAISKIVAK